MASLTTADRPAASLPLSFDTLLGGLTAILAALLAGWLLFGTVQLTEYSGTSQGLLGVDRLPVMEITATANGFRRFDLRASPQFQSDRGFVVRLRAADRPETDLAHWVMSPYPQERFGGFEFAPITDSAGKKYLILLEPGPGSLPPPALAMRPGSGTVLALGDTIDAGFEMRRYYTVSPLAWAGVMVGRVWDSGRGLLILIAAVAYGAAIWLLVRRLGRLRPAQVILAGLVSIALLGALQAVSSNAVWASAGGMPAVERGSIAVDIVRLVNTSSVTVRNIDGLTDARKRAYFGVDVERIMNEFRPIIFTHPPTIFDVTVSVPENSRLRYAIAMRPDTWNRDDGDGAGFEVWVVGNGAPVRIMNDYINPRREIGDRIWHDRDIDLSPWVGQTVTLSFRTTVGPNFDESYDFAAWAKPVIVRQ